MRWSSSTRLVLLISASSRSSFRFARSLFTFTFCFQVERGDKKSKICELLGVDLKKFQTDSSGTILELSRNLIG